MSVINLISTFEEDSLFTEGFWFIIKVWLSLSPFLIEIQNVDPSLSKSVLYLSNTANMQAVVIIREIRCLFNSYMVCFLRGLWFLILFFFLCMGSLYSELMKLSQVKRHHHTKNLRRKLKEDGIQSQLLRYPQRLILISCLISYFC